MKIVRVLQKWEGYVLLRGAILLLFILLCLQYICYFQILGKNIAVLGYKENINYACFYKIKKLQTPPDPNDFDTAPLRLDAYKCLKII